jgi:ribosomal protein S18 acetylase RimI-like enzyme
MPIRAFQPQDAPALARLASECARGETDFVLNPLWENEDELFAEFNRHGADPEEHVLVADLGDGEVVGLSGFLRRPPATLAGLLCPIVARDQRGKGVGGELLRAALAHGAERLGVKLVTAGIGTRNRAGYALLSGCGFRPVRQHFLLRCDEQPTLHGAPIQRLELEEARPDDADAILELYTACGFEARTPETMRSILGDGRHAHAVARFGGRIVAFAELETHWPERTWVAFVGVDADLRDRGVGSALVAWAVRRRFEAGARSALLLLSPANRTGLRAYEKVGFRRHRLVDVLEKGL